MRFTLEYLKSLGRKPRVHPNGFVQFDIEPNILRLNVWPADPIPGHPGRVHPVHNHSFDLRSRVIHGALTNRTFHFYPSLIPFRREAAVVGDEVVMHEARRVGDHDSVLAPVEGQPCGYLTLMTSGTHKAGESYTLERSVLHDSVPVGLTATLMTLERPSPVYKPLVAVPLGVKPMNGYSREAFDEGLLWEIVAKVL